MRGASLPRELASASRAEGVCRADSWQLIEYPAGKKKTAANQICSGF
jgi:hypothetical protein